MPNFFNPIPIGAEPKRKNRFIIQFPTDFGIQEWSVLTGGRPKLTIGETEIPVINTSQWVAGKYVWDPMDITFIDTITGAGGPGSGLRILDWINKCVKGVRNPGPEASIYSMGWAAEYMIPLRIYTLDPYGAPVELWILENAFVTNYDGGDLDKASDDLATITISVRFAPCHIEYMI